MNAMNGTLKPVLVAPTERRTSQSATSRRAGEESEGHSAAGRRALFI